jgi:hypothetical protein
MYYRAKNGVFVEVAAHHPTHVSQASLLETKGWSGVPVEPQPDLAALLREKRPRSVVFECAMTAPDRPGVACLVVPDSTDSAYVKLWESPRQSRGFP